MLRIERIEAVDLPQLAGLYDQLVEEKTDRERMKEVFIRMNKRDDYYLLGVKTETDLLIGCIMGIVCLDLLKQGLPFIWSWKISLWIQSGTARGLGNCCWLKSNPSPENETAFSYSFALHPTAGLHTNFMKPAAMI